MKSEKVIDSEIRKKILDNWNESLDEDIVDSGEIDDSKISDFVEKAASFVASEIVDMISFGIKYKAYSDLFDDNN